MKPAAAKSWRLYKDLTSAITGLSPEHRARNCAGVMARYSLCPTATTSASTPCTVSGVCNAKPYSCCTSAASAQASATTTRTPQLCSSRIKSMTLLLRISGQFSLKVIPNAPRFLISEAMRGEGAQLKNVAGKRFMPSYHPMAELAPRDVVTQAIFSEMQKTNSNHVLLDNSHLEPQGIKTRFPLITATCLQYGLDIRRELIPVAPAAHYMMGGVKINMWGETSIEGLFSCGESSCLGVHGANRLASNSLLEGLVMGERIAKRCASLSKSKKRIAKVFVNTTLKTGISCDYGVLRQGLKKNMDQKVGPLRTGVGLSEALQWFKQWEHLSQYEVRDVREIEVRNMLTAGRLVAKAAALRTESRGGHFRQDYPTTLASWRRHLSLKK